MEREGQGAGTHPLECGRMPELLAPAGSLDAFKAALAAGADAIYCGLGSFNARRNAENMDSAQFEEACEMAHLAGSRVYVATNILVRDDELPRALSLVRDAAAAGADAFIIQDWGLLLLVREYWPELECHLSTQANVGDPRGVLLAATRGASRVTLPRELSLPEIAACAATGVEVEVFAHGALCVCYSGECLLSSMQRGKSANRGLCRQPCRLPYELLDESGADAARVGGTRLLSTRDACTIADLPALAAAGVTSLKIEGRMKAPDYVATVVGAYRRALDELAHGADSGRDAEVDRELRRAFNRDFTDAYLHGRSGNAMMSYERGNNRGQLAGTLAGMRGRMAVLAMDEPLGEGDLLEIRNPDRFDDYVTVPAPADSPAGARVDVRLPRPMPANCPVRVIRSEAGMTRAREYAARSWPRKRPVDVGVRARLGEPLAISLGASARDAHPQLGVLDVRVEAAGPVVGPARTRPVTTEDLREHVGRLGSSPFEARGWDVQMDEGVGLSFSSVHAVRAEAAELLRQKLLAPWETREVALAAAPCSLPTPRHGRGEGRKTRAGHDVPATPEAKGGAGVMPEVGGEADARTGTAPAAKTAAGTQNPGPAQGPDDPTNRRSSLAQAEVCALVTSPAMARAALAAGATRLYAMADDLLGGPGSSTRPDLSPESGDWPAGMIAVLGEVGRASELEEAQGLAKAGESIVAGTVGALELAHEAGALPELWDSVPLHNASAFAALSSMGARGCWLSPELTLLEIERLAPAAGMPLGIIVSGHVRLMTTEHCVLQSMGDCAAHCVTCPRRRRAMTLRDEFGREVVVTSDRHGRSRLWQQAPIDLTPQTTSLLACGVTRLMADGRLMSPDQLAAQVRRVARAVDTARSSRPPERRAPGATSGHLFEPVG